MNKNLYLITLSETIKITKKTEYFGESIINQIYKRQDKITFIGNYMITTSVGEIKFNFTKLKKTAHAYF